MKVYTRNTRDTNLRSHIPEDLKQDASWVLWRYIKRDGKWTKEPYQANRERAKTNDPRTWTTFDKALEAYEQDDYFDGIGFVFHEDNPYAGGDIDHATEDQAREWIDRFDSYTERSPSGNGLHIIIKAELPQGTKRDTGELYSSGRFFTMTGDVVRDLPVREAQEAAGEFYKYLRKDDQKPRERAPESFDTPDMDDAEVLRLLENAKNGHENMEVYAGGGEFPSGSERDLSLANRTAFYTQHEDQIERIMRGSGCAREKWDKHRTYLRDTIRKAISGQVNTYAPAGVTNIATKRASKKTKLSTGVKDLRRRWWDYDWARVVGTGKKSNWMRGHTCRDLMKALIDTTEKHGEIVGDNIEVSIGRRKLALLAATSTRTIHKAIGHLEAEGWLEFKPPESDNKPGRYVLRATLHQVLSISTEGVELEGNQGGGEDLRAPRLRWSAPYVPRLGKHNCAIIDHLVEGGDMHIDDLAEATNKRSRDLLRNTVHRKGNLVKLQEAGIVEVDGSMVRLAADWREALERKREEDGEIEAEERDRKKYREQSEAYRNRDRTSAGEVPPLVGKEKTAELQAKLAKDEEKRRIEYQRQKVGVTAGVFVHDKLKALGRIRLGLLQDTWSDTGGDRKDILPAVVRLGCKIERLLEYGNEQFIYPPLEKTG